MDVIHQFQMVEAPLLSTNSYLSQAESTKSRPEDCTKRHNLLQLLRRALPEGLRHMRRRTLNGRKVPPLSPTAEALIIIRIGFGHSYNAEP